MAEKTPEQNRGKVQQEGEPSVADELSLYTDALGSDFALQYFARGGIVQLPSGTLVASEETIEHMVKQSGQLDPDISSGDVRMSRDKA